MHLDGVGDLREDHGLHLLCAALKEVALLLHYAAGNLEERVIPGLEALDDPLGLLQVVPHVLPLVGGAALRYLGVALVDAELSRKRRVEEGLPDAVYLPDDYVRINVLAAVMLEG